MPITRVPAGLAGHIVLVIAEVIGDLTLQRRLQHPLGQLLQQPALTDQIQPLGPGLGDQLTNQILASLPCVLALDRLAGLGHRRGLRLRFSCRHQVSLIDQELHRKPYSPAWTRYRWETRPRTPRIR
jgi:hypothetical protein